jgi:hypothetical protein
MPPNQPRIPAVSIRNEASPQGGPISRGLKRGIYDLYLHCPTSALTWSFGR